MTSGLLLLKEKLPGLGFENERVLGRDEGGLVGSLGREMAESVRRLENFLSLGLVKKRGGPVLHGAEGASHGHGESFLTAGTWPSKGSGVFPSVDVPGC